MTSPIGVVPQELELTYPAQHYDAVVTGRWSEGEVAFVAGVLADYLRANPYERVIAHVPPGGYRDIVGRAVERLAVDGTDLDVEYTVADHPTTDESLASLDSALDGEEQYRKRERQHNTLRAVADFQFGDGAGDDLFPELSVRGRYPKLQADGADGEQLAALVPSYGVLALTLAGARDRRLRPPRERAGTGRRGRVGRRPGRGRGGGRRAEGVRRRPGRDARPRDGREHPRRRGGRAARRGAVRDSSTAGRARSRPGGSAVRRRTV
jgi:hypothetical protein